MNLTLIGNGFDLNNGYKTSFADFKYFVKTNHSKFSIVIQNTFPALEGLWSNIEDAMFLSNRHLEETISGYYDDAAYNIESDDDPGKTDGSMHAAVSNDLSTNLISSQELDSLIIEWLNSIKFKLLYLEDDDSRYYINFNYTNYLVASKILNIHGSLDSSIKFGHSKNEGVLSDKSMYGNDEISWSRYYNSFNKDTENNIKTMNDFLKHKEIESLTIKGLSLGTQDVIYLKAIGSVKHLYYYYHTISDLERLKSIKTLYDDTTIEYIKW